MNNNKLVAVVGMCGSGKTEAVSRFLEAGFDKVYFGDVTFNEIKKQGLEINETNERKVREELRKTGDIAIYAKKIEPEIREKLAKNNVVIESLYAWSEYKYLKEIYGDKLEILAIVTDRELRLKRLKNRPIRPLTKEDFYKRDYSQIEKLEQGGPIAHANHFITNNRGIKEFYKKVDKYIIKILKK